MKLTPAQQRMMDALSWLAAQPDLCRPGINLRGAGQYATARALARRGLVNFHPSVGRVEDRKSTRLNSSHVKISYAVFCLKKKKKKHKYKTQTRDTVEEP